jgi:predicted permease
MPLVAKTRSFFRTLFRRQHAERSLSAELESYVEERIAKGIAAGVPPAESRRRVLAELGGVESLKEEVRDAWLGRGIESTLQDLRYACRTLRRSPAFTLVVVATLALGIGANLTMFSLLRSVLWRPLPYPQSDRIVSLGVDVRSVSNAGATPQEVIALAQHAQSLEHVSTIDFADRNLFYEGQSERVTAANISDNFLPLLGARPAQGRLLHAATDTSPQQPLAALISDDLWHRRFSADPRVVGKALRLDDWNVQIAGVLPPAFRLFLPPSVSGEESADVWLPYRLDPTDPYRGVPVIARLKAGVTLSRANAELQRLAAQFQRDYPDLYSGAKAWQSSSFDLANANLHFTAYPIRDEITREARPALLFLSLAVALVLLIACVNVANLILARNSIRRRELEIRRTLGAGRSRIVRQLLLESLLLALASAAIGLFVAHFALRALAHQGASYIPLQSRIGMDSSVALFALLLSIVTTLIFGLLPAFRFTSEKGGQALRTGRSITLGSGARRLQRVLVVAEIALSIVPLVCSGLMLRSFVNLLNAPLGFNPSQVVTARVPFDAKRYPTTGQRFSLLRGILDHVRALPGVHDASAANPLPLAGQERRRVGRADRSDAPPVLATQQFALPGYLHAIGTPLLAGRDLTDADITADRAVVLIDEGLAKNLFPEGAVGKRLAVYRTGWHSDLEIIGVTARMRATSIRDDKVSHFILPFAKYPSEMSLVIQTPLSAAQIAPSLRAAVDAAHAGRPAYDVRSMRSYVLASIGDTRFVMLVLAIFAGASVLLTAVGLYGTLAYLTAQRTSEFGIRLALGSDVRSLVSIVVKESVILAALGSLLGLLAVTAVTGFLRQMLYGVQPFDGITLSTVVSLFLVLALCAAVVPAWRVTRIDPQNCLRSE